MVGRGSEVHSQVPPHLDSRGRGLGDADAQVAKRQGVFRALDVTEVSK